MIGDFCLGNVTPSSRSIIFVGEEYLSFNSQTNGMVDGQFDAFQWPGNQHLKHSNGNGQKMEFFEGEGR